MGLADAFNNIMRQVVDAGNKAASNAARNAGSNNIVRNRQQAANQPQSEPFNAQQQKQDNPWISSFLPKNEKKDEPEDEEKNLSNTPWYDMPYEGSEEDPYNVRHLNNLSQLDNVFSSNDEKAKRNQAIENFFTSMVTPREDATDNGIPYLADYNGFRMDDFPVQQNKDEGKTGIQGASEDIDELYKTGAAQDENENDDLEKRLLDQYFYDSGLGSKYSGVGDFMARGDFEEWYNMVNDPLLSDLYRDSEYEQFGDLHDRNNFQNYWDYYTANDMSDVIYSMPEQYLATSGGLIDDIAPWLVANGYVDEMAMNDLGLQYDPETWALTGARSDEDVDKAVMLTKYQIGDRMLQSMLDEGISGDEFLNNRFNQDEINSVFALDPIFYTTNAGDDVEGLLNDLDKDKNVRHSTDYISGSFDKGIAPYPGLADTFKALAGDKLYYKTRETE